MRRQFLWFALAGAAGFLVDISVLYGAVYAGAGYYLGRILSFTAAATTTWLINRHYAFAHAADERLLEEWLRYMSAMLGGGAVNYLIYVICLHVLPSGSWLPLFAVAAGSVAGLLVNFMTAKNWVFRSRGS